MIQRAGTYILAILFLLPIFADAQQNSEDLVDWSASKKLTWSDYKAGPNPNSDAAASTTTYLGIEYNISQDGMGFKIQCRFSRTRSWGRHKSEYILQHEQGHFDIAEIFARKLNKEMLEYKFNKKTYAKDLDKIYNDLMKEKEETQNKYDRESNHSIIKEKQMEWLKKINEMLEEYKAYAGYN